MKLKYRWFPLLCLALLSGMTFFSGPVFSFPSTTGTFRIGLTALGKPTMFYLVPSDGKIEIFCPTKKDGIYSGAAKVIVARKMGTNLQILVDNRQVFSGTTPVLLSPIGKPPHYLWIGSQKKLKKAFRGTMEISLQDSGLFAVNVVNVTEYLRSVVPAEIGSKVPEDAFAAQAIAARTYAFRNRDRHAKDGYQLCDKQHCQVYFGIQREISLANKAINKTIGQVLLYGDSLANTVYHCNCGGKIHASHEIWGGKGVPYLVTHLDTLGSSEPFCSWSARGGRRVEKITAVSTPAKSALTAKKGSPPPGKRKELKFSFHSPRGHRVGMCQDGAIGMAKQGYSYHQILSFYYPNTALKSMESRKGHQLQIADSKSSFAKGNRLVLAQDSQLPAPALPEALPRIDSVTRGMKTKDFRKWFWHATQPTIYQRGMKIAAVNSKPSPTGQNHRKKRNSA